MSKLEEIVPPLELCRRIPAGEFEESALAWGRDVNEGEFFVYPREDIIDTVSPAPTLAEILAELPFTDGSNRTPVCCGRWVDDLSMWVVGYRNIDELRETDKSNPASAALRMWLRQKGIEE